MNRGTQLGQPDTQLGAQPGTQPADRGTQPSDPDTTDMLPLDTSIILRVMDRHSLDQAWAATAINRDKSYLSRMASGQYPVPVALLQALWSKTGDQELLTLFSADSARLLAVAAPDGGEPRTLDAAYREMVRALGDVLRLDASVHKGPPPLKQLTAADAAIGAIADYQQALVRAHDKATIAGLATAYTRDTDQQPPRIDRLA